MQLLHFTPQVLGEKIVSCSLDIGKAYKNTTDSAVWFVTTDDFTADGSCARRAFRNASVYDSYGLARWSDVNVVSNIELESVPEHTIPFIEWGKKRTYLHGQLIKTPSDPNVYMLLGKTKHRIVSEDVFNGYGLDWSAILDVFTDVLALYTTSDTDLDGSIKPEGLLYKHSDSSNVYIIENGQEKNIENEADFVLNGYSWSGVVTLE